jgi:L-lysine exporter family protein LysE/ArgO
MSTAAPRATALLTSRMRRTSTTFKPATVAQSVGLSVLNPHAVLDTVGVLGAAIVAQAAQERIMFATGAVGPSWVW